MKKKITSLLIALSFISGITFSADIDVSENIKGDSLWTADNDYYLDGFIFVEDGATLTIEPGTVIRGYNGTGENASALIVKRGGKIMAEGTAEKPIIFTSEDDANLDLPPSVKGSWGGLILLGKGTHNNLTNDNGIEGVPADQNAYYGGDDEADNSGILKYVSIRHGGSELAPDEEINGLTLGAIGSGTSISFIEVMGNDDDGIEWFGGSVSLKYVVVADVADDGYDIDEGYNGKLQFIYTEQNDDGTGDNFGEHDGGPSSNRWGEPYATPVISNATYIGSGASGGNRCLTLREMFAGQYHNSIFAEQQKGIRVEYVPEFSGGAKGGSFTQWSNGLLKIENNIFQNVADGTAAGIFSVYSPETGDPPVPIYTVPQDSINAFVSYANTKNTINNSMGITKIDPVPDSLDVKGAVFNGLDTWFDNVIYKGAFNPCVMNGNWAGGWTYTYESIAYNASTEGSCYTASPNALTTNKLNSYSKVYPNPASTEITVSFKNEDQEDVMFTMFNLNGQVVLSASTSDNSFRLDITDLSSGLYTYRLTNAEKNIISMGQVVVE